MMEAILSGKSVNLIICDDELDATEELAEFLEEAGIRLRIAHSVGEAQREIAGTDMPICVVTDMKMPGADGTDLVRWIRTEVSAEKRCIPVLLVSGHVPPAEPGSKALDAFDLHLQKPVDPYEILDVLRQLGLAP
jgi:CheY-like chemotaxis protein